MPLILERQEQDNCTLEECIDALAVLRPHIRDPESVTETALWLRRLTNNRTFLSDFLIERMRHDGPRRETAYSPQSMVLSAQRGGVFLRANIWPAVHDECYRTSGPEAFVYGVPHDHNFSFLTSGYLGPGYLSDYYEYDYEDVLGYPGEKVPLRFVERSALSQGKILLYRAHRDVHSQIPPERLSVSLNAIFVDPSQSWFDQYGFDLEGGKITRIMNANAHESFLRIAVASGSPDALDYAEQVGRTHPSDRLRLASFEARAALSGDAASIDAIWREGELSGSRLVAAVARQRRTAND